MGKIIINEDLIRRFFNEIISYGFNNGKGMLCIAQTIFRKNKDQGYVLTTQKTGNRFCPFSVEDFVLMARELENISSSFEGVTLYAGAVPIDAAAAGRTFLTDMMSKTLPLVGNKEQYDSLMTGLPRHYFSALEKCPAKKKLIHFAVDVASFNGEASARWVKEALDDSGAYNRVVTTRGGFHVFAEPQAMAYASSAFGIKKREDAMATLIDDALGGATTECQPCSSIMCPLPGTAQRSADFVVGIL
jgi:hypothetical protein